MLQTAVWNWVMEIKTIKVKLNPRTFKPLVAAIPLLRTHRPEQTFPKKGEWQVRGKRFQAEEWHSVTHLKWEQFKHITMYIHHWRHSGSCLYLLTIPVTLSLKYGFIKWPKNTFPRFLPSPALDVLEPSSSAMTSFCNTRMNWTASVSPPSSWFQTAVAEPSQTSQGSNLQHQTLKSVQELKAGFGTFWVCTVQMIKKINKILTCHNKLKYNMQTTHFLL